MPRCGARRHLRRLASPGRMLVFWGWPNLHHHRTNQIPRLMSVFICSGTAPEPSVSSAVPQLSTHLFSHPREISVATKTRMSMTETEILRTGPMAGVEVLKQEEIKELGRTLMTDP